MAYRRKKAYKENDLEGADQQRWSHIENDLFDSRKIGSAVVNDAYDIHADSFME